LALRNDLLDKVQPKVREQLEGIEITEEEMNIDCIEDSFGPISEPKEEYFRMPEETKVVFIGSEEEVKLAEPLLDMPLIGIDSEWRPALVKFNHTNVALLQIGNTQNVYLIDMVALKESQVLDELLVKVFTSEDINIIGMSIQSDLGELSKGFPKLNFFRKIQNLYDVQPMYGSIYKQKGGLGLSKIVDAILGYKVCKFEQMANWERRPLRLSQQHYSALDSYILVELFEKMRAYAEENEIDITDYRNTYIMGKTKLSQKSAGITDFKVQKEKLAKGSIRTIKLKAGESVAPNAELSNAENVETPSFCIDYNLSRLHKFLLHKGFESFKIQKKTNALERVEICREGGKIFVTKDDKKFNKTLSIPSLLIRKGDSTAKQFNALMKYFEREETATNEDVDALKVDDEE